MSAPLQPAVTAIIIFLDEERFLAEAVESVLAQSLTDWELILVDDGSGDRSPEIARAYAERHPRRVRCLMHPGGGNRGMSASRNLGVGAARGRYVGFLDADDVWMADKLAEQRALLEAHPRCGLVYGRTVIWRSWNSGGDDFLYPLGVEADTVHEPPRLFELLVENKAQSPTTCNALIRRSLFDRIGGFEDRFHGMFEDQAFFAKALLAAPAYVDGRIWAKYRQHEASCSARSARAGADLAHRRRILKWMDEALAEALAPHPSARARLAEEIRRTRRLALRRGARRLLRRVVAPLTS